MNFTMHCILGGMQFACLPSLDRNRPRARFMRGGGVGQPAGGIKLPLRRHGPVA
jgi:hypothetical protein